MGGDATFSGTTYQANVIAYIAVHVLTETKLRWLPVPDDTPIAVAGEVKGPGDDARIEFASSAPIEVQAKHGLKGFKSTEEIVTTVRDASASDDPSIVVIAVDSSASPSIRVDLRKDLDRLRSGRTDDLQEITNKVVADIGAGIVDTLRRIRVVILDVDVAGDQEVARAKEMLAENLEDPTQAEAAWALLQADGGLMCATRLRRSRSDLVALLASAGIRVRPPRKTRRWHDDLRHSKTFLSESNPDAALALLSKVESELVSGSPDADILYRLNQHKAAAFLQLYRFDKAIAFAERALDHDPSGLHALVNLANAHALADHTTEARSVSEKVRRLHPNEGVAWVVAAQVAAILGDPIPPPPSHIEASKEYRKGLIKVRLYLDDVMRARGLARALLAEGDRSPTVVLLLVDALLADMDEVDADTRMEQSREVARLCTELIESARLSDAELRRALVGRSLAERILGQVEEAQADINRAREASPDDPTVIAAFAQAKIQGGDEEGALAQLNRPVVDEAPQLLAMRAALQATRDVKAARRDLDALIKILTDSPEQPNQVLSAAAEAAIQLGETECAARFLSQTSTEFRASGHYLLLEGRIAWIQGDRTKAEELYRRAADQIPSHRPELIGELATKLVTAKDSAAAVTLFRELDRIPDGAHKPFARALIEIERLGEALDVIEKASRNGVLPDWAVAYAAEIAHRRNDPEIAAQHLEELVARGRADAVGRLTLVDTLLGLEQDERARAHIDELLKDDELEPRERMILAQILVRVGRSNEAVATALQAYREAPTNPELNRAFAGVVLTSKRPPDEVNEVGPDTHVLLRHESGAELQFVIFSRPSSQTLPHEIAFDAARSAGLIGLRAGDTFVQNAGSWVEKRWTVIEIQSATNYVFNDVLTNYQARFPQEPFFVAGFNVTPNVSVTDLQPMIAAAHDIDKRSDEILTLYRDQVLPLDFVANLAGRNVPQVMAHISESSDTWPLFVEWYDEGAQFSLEAARESKPVVVTRSSLFTLQRMNLLENVASNRRLIAPRSLRDVLRRELSEAEENVKEGTTSMGKGPTGLTFQSFKPGDEALIRHRDSRRKLLEWADKNIEFHPRPLEAFGNPTSLSSEFRGRLGESASDALELAKHTSSNLYADDLGLRRIANATEMGVRSFSTISLLQALAEATQVTPEERDSLLVDLAERHYNAIRVSPELLIEVLRRSSPDSIRAVFSLLAGPSMDPITAARTIIRAVRIAAFANIQTTSISEIVRSGLAAMALKFPSQTCARVVAQVAEDELMLLPIYLQTVRGLCREFLRKPWAF